MFPFFRFALALFFLFVSACAHKEEKLSAESTYLKAYELLKNHSYSEAATMFEKIDDEFPSSKLAPKAQTMAVYANFKNEEFEKVIQNVEDFSRSYANSEFMPYMLYMKGLSYYLRIPEISRAQDETKKASYAFRELIARFPNDEHSFDAKEKLEFVDEHLAGAEMSVARYEIRTKNYVGAIKSLEEVLLRYRTSKQVPEALFRIAEIYHKLGVSNLSKKALASLSNEYPENYWTILSKKELSK